MGWRGNQALHFGLLRWRGGPPKLIELAQQALLILFPALVSGLNLQSLAVDVAFNH
jgi:hypothetical protein